MPYERTVEEFGFLEVKSYPVPPTLLKYILEDPRDDLML